MEFTTLHAIYIRVVFSVIAIIASGAIAAMWFPVKDPMAKLVSLSYVDRLITWGILTVSILAGLTDGISDGYVTWRALLLAIAPTVAAIVSGAMLVFSLRLKNGHNCRHDS